MIQKISHLDAHHRLLVAIGVVLLFNAIIMALTINTISGMLS